MTRFSATPPFVRVLSRVVICLALLLPGLRAVRADDTVPAEKKPAVELKTLPENIDDLKAMQKQVKEVLKKVIPATVGVRVGGASGSGVIIDKEGHILTAAHVSGKPDVNVTVILADGRTVKGKTLGLNRGIDSGLIKIEDKGDWSFVEMGKSGELKKGEWCIATGHPGGFRPGRAPVVRLGRVQDAGKSYIRSDCALVAGDSGGPLFNLEGHVIGIHSSIGGTLAQNMHVPVDTYRETWDRLVKGDSWGGRTPPVAVGSGVWMGIEASPTDVRCTITKVVENSPAEKAGLKAEDVILKFDGSKIASFDDLPPLLNKKKIGDKVALEVQRGKETVKLELVLGKREG